MRPRSDYQEYTLGVTQSANGKCIGCDYNDGGYCRNHKKWAHNLYMENCKEPVKPPKKVIEVVKKTVSKRRKVHGYTNVYCVGRRFQALVWHDGKQFYLGLYKTKELAAKAVAVKEIQLKGKVKSNLHLKQVQQLM